MRFKLNNEDVSVQVPADVPTLWVLREELNKTGTKFGCGMGLCGACTCHLNGQPIRSCVTPISAVEGQSLTTIEGIDPNANHPVQQAWRELNVVQCGYCQPGQLMAAAALLASNPNPDDKAIENAMSGNLCRCGTYDRIRKGVKRAAELMRQGASK
jgi:isoquinoline 1-oxidoreductase alpha subunit